jgi:hypothetical protein
VIEWAVIGLAWICGLVAFGAVLLLILDHFKRPHEPAVPDFVPDDWGPSKAAKR